MNRIRTSEPENGSPRRKLVVVAGLIVVLVLEMIELTGMRAAVSSYQLVPLLGDAWTARLLLLGEPKPCLLTANSR
jgi:hypothetical protein